MKSRSRFMIGAMSFVLTAVGGSYFLLPSDQQIALNNYKDKEYGQALKSYEEQFANGNLSVDTVSTLTKVYLQYAKIDEAIDVMESFVGANPSSIEARQELGRLYQYGQRTDDYVKNLEAMNQLAASSEGTKKLMETYNIQGEDNKNIPFMMRKILEESQGSLQEHRNLANILASAKEYEQALAVLTLMQKKYDAEMLFSDFELILRMHAEMGNKAEAEKFAISLVGKNFSDTEFARIANVLLFLISPEAAHNYVAALPEKAQLSDAVFEQNITILQSLGKKEQAYEVALERYKQGKLSRDLLDDLMLLSSYVGNKKLLTELRDKIDYETLGTTDILVLLEVANNAGDGELMRRLQERGKIVVAQTNDEYLAAMLGLMAGNGEDQQKITRIMESEAMLTRRLAIAQLCAKRKMGTCVEAFFKQLPPTDTLSDSELIATIQLLQESNSRAKAFELAKTAIAEREGAAFQNAWFPLAAVFENAEVIKPYLVEGASFEDKTYRDGYYLAMDEKNYANATLIAEYLYSKKENDENRNFVSQSYLRAGNYEQALPLLRATKDATKNGEGDYLFVLTKLSKTNPIYGAELRKYGVSILASNADGKRKQMIIGALIEGGQQSAIMPYIKGMAMDNPREWAYLYAGYLLKTQGQPAVTEFWQQVVARHKGDVELRRQVAYNLLENGEKTVAIDMFMGICDDVKAKPSDDLVQQLLYLWSPIYPENALVWLNNKAAVAADTNDKRAWLVHMANGTSDDGLLELAKRQPALLEISSVENRYITALAKIDDASLSNYLQQKTAATQDIAQLLSYADTAQSYGLRDEARNAYDAALKISPANPLVLGKAGVFAASEANYVQSSELLNNYFKAELPSLPNTIEAYRPHFYHAENLRRENDNNAKKYYAQVVEAAKSAPMADTELQSLGALSLARLGKKKQAIAAFEKLIATKPNDRQLRADYSAMLVDLQEYDIAKKSLPVWRENMVAQTSYEPANVGGAQTDYRSADGGAKMIVRNNGGNIAKIKQLPWVAYVVEGRDEALVVAKDEVNIQAMSNDSGEVFLHPVAQKNRQLEKLNQQFMVQNELINARIEVENGQGYAASQRTRALTKNHPNNPQVLGFAANVENFNGNWPYARRLINKAHQLQPRNDDIISLQRGIERLHASNLYIDGHWRALGKSNEYIGSAGGSYDVNENVQVGLDLQNNSVRSTILTLSDGKTGKFNEERQRGEAYLRYFDELGDTSQVSLFANNDTAGLGAYHSFSNQLGLSNVGLEFQRPDWQFVQGVIDDATRSRAFVGHRFSPSNPVTIEGQLGVNQYNTKNGNNLSSTITAQGSVSYRLQQVPYFALSYNLDLEHELNDKRGILPNGQEFQLFPMQSREVHSVGVLASHNFSKDTNAEGFASYGYERISGQSGPAVEGRVTHYLDDKWAVQGHAGYGFRGGANNGSLSQGGVRLMYRY